MEDDPLEFKFVQSFGDDNSSEDDLVTAVEFDSTGDYLAVGDKAGRICIFEANNAKTAGQYKRGIAAHTEQKTWNTIDMKNHNDHEEEAAGAAGAGAGGWPIEYKFYTEFQSHEPEYDCLKSLEIEEKINMVKFCHRTSTGLFMLAANDKTIKLWKVHDKKMPNTTSPTSINNVNAILMPHAHQSQKITVATPKQIFANAHAYHINSVSLNSDGFTFLSADDLRVNLWSLDVADTCFNIIDIKPDNLEELTEVITSACFHPTSCHQLVYTSSRGTIRLCDLRDSALADNHAKVFESDDDPVTRSFFSEIVNSISDAKFTPDGRYIVSRDYMTMKIWDMAMESRPVAVIPVHDYLVQHLADLYENDCIFDKFECVGSFDSMRFVTGSYNNHFIVYNMATDSSVMMETLRDAPRLSSGSIGTAPSVLSPLSSSSSATTTTAAAGALSSIRKERILMAHEPNVSLMDFAKKTLHLAYHPHSDCIAIAGLNRLYLHAGFSSESIRGLDGIGMNDDGIGMNGVGDVSSPMSMSFSDV